MGAFTYFFRDMQTLEVIVKHVIPAVAGRSKIRIWDAGCASGQEPFSLAILFAENMGPFGFRNFHIDATDLDVGNLFHRIITEGVYKEEELRRMPRDYFEKYFQPAEKRGYYRIDERIRSKVSYRRHDLLSLQPIGYDYCLILCKNVLLHLRPSERIEVIKMFHSALVPGGYLAMEQTQKMPRQVAHLFEQVTPCAQLYRKISV